MKENINFKMIRKSSIGITLIALVITIIVLLILSAISISMLTGDNSIIKNAIFAKENTKIAEEKEIIEKATIQAMGKNKYGNLKQSELENELNEIVGTGNIKVLIDNEIVSSENSEVNISDYVFEDKNDSDIIVEFINTNHKYLVNTDGTVSEQISSNTEKNTDWENINYEIRTDKNENQYCVVTGLKNGISKSSITMVNIAKSYKGIPVTTISDSAFSGCSNLKKVVLGSLVTSIGHHAFSGCTKLSHIKLPNSITSMSYEVFSNCTNLTKAGVGVTEGIELEEGITKIVNGTFRGSNLKEIVIPDTVTIIEDRAFQVCKNLAEIKIPDNITVIGSCCFDGCTNLTKVEWGKGIKDIRDHAFARCTKLSHIKIPNSVISMSYDVFSGCTNLTKAGVGVTEGIELEEGITKIVVGTFRGSNLEEIVIPDTVTKIESCAFYGCNKLLNITYKGTSHTTEKSLKSSGITSIGERAFYGTSITAE